MMNLKQVLKELEAEDFGKMEVEQSIEAYSMALESLYGAVLKINEGIRFDEDYNYERKGKEDEKLLFSLDEIKEIRNDVQIVLNRLSGMLAKRNSAVDKAMKKDTLSVD